MVDHGDLVNVSWIQDPSINVNLDILQSAEEVQERLHTFFGKRPKN
jgi:hypothetical protein